MSRIITQYGLAQAFSSLRRFCDQLERSTDVLEFFLLTGQVLNTASSLRQTVECQRDRWSRLFPSALFSLTMEFLPIREVLQAESICRKWHGYLQTNTILWKQSYLGAGWCPKIFEPDGSDITLTDWRERVRYRMRVQENWFSGNSQQFVFSHEPKVYGVSLFKHLFATAGHDSNIKIWNTRTGTLEKNLAGHNGLVNIARFLSGRRVISGGGADYLAKVWDIESETCVQDLRGHGHGILDLVIHGTNLLTASADQTVKLWDLEAGGWSTHTFRGHTDYVRSVTNVQENRFLSASYDTTLREWDLVSGECIRTLQLRSKVYGVLLDQNTIYSGSDDTLIRIWNTHRQKCLQVLRGHTGGVMALVKVGTCLVTSASDGMIKVWNLARSMCVQTMTDHGISEVPRMDSDGIRLVTGDLKGQARVWDFKPKKRK